MKKFEESKENKNTTILFVQNEKLRKEMKKKRFSNSQLYCFRKLTNLSATIWIPYRLTFDKFIDSQAGLRLIDHHACESP